MQIEEILQEIIRICVNNSATKVILFGSRAKGTALERSDIDIAVCGTKDIEKNWKIFDLVKFEEFQKRVEQLLSEENY